MAIAWSRISSKVIAHPPYTNEACRRRCGNGKSRLDAYIPSPCGALPHGVRVREPEEALPIVFVGGITHHQMLRPRIYIAQTALEDTRPVQGRAATRAKRLRCDVHGDLRGKRRNAPHRCLLLGRGDAARTDSRP